jgi:hypothetical protein
MDNENKIIAGNIRWLAQVILGILLVLLVSIHLIVNHWVAPQGLLTYADIIRYYDFPGIAMMEAIFLIIPLLSGFTWNSIGHQPFSKCYTGWHSDINCSRRNNNFLWHLVNHKHSLIPVLACDGYLTHLP